ncbi:hypothetical protein XENTR_v10004877 [Xenopus tropicalis]|nr:hypothetical protein XENTR_v10004877 [Xenopus tropicalis]
MFPLKGLFLSLLPGPSSLLLLYKAGQGTQIQNHVDLIEATQNFTQYLTQCLPLKMEPNTTFNPGLQMSSLNGTTPGSQSTNEFDAAWYIVAMVGFFGFLMFSVLLINMLNPVEDELLHLKYDDQIQKNLSLKDSEKDAMCFVNTAALLPRRTDCNSELLDNPDTKQNHSEVNPVQSEDVGLTVSTRL